MPGVPQRALGITSRPLKLTGGVFDLPICQGHALLSKEAQTTLTEVDMSFSFGNEWKRNSPLDFEVGLEWRVGG